MRAREEEQRGRDETKGCECKTKCVTAVTTSDDCDINGGIDSR